mgnify:CR=1 FL=1
MSLHYSRVFVSLKLTTAVLDYVKDVMHSLQMEFREGVRWIRPETAHVTVQFIGEVSKASLGDVIAKIGSVTPNVSPFTLLLKSPEVAPTLKRPRLIWIPLIGQTEEIQHLFLEVRSAVRNCGIGLDDKRLLPHITLGRISRPQYFNDHRAVEKKLEQYARSAIIQLKVSEIAVVQSILGPSGPTYIDRKQYYLGA